jgi:hypothetical protein
MRDYQTPLTESTTQNQIGESPRLSVPRLMPPRTLAAAVLAVGLLAAGCSGGSSNPRVASVASVPQASHRAVQSSGSPGPLAYALCMRSHGVTNYPEPDSQGNLQVEKSQQLPDVNSPQFEAAAKTCVSLRAATTVSPSQQAKQVAQAVKYAQCMRSAGITNFPDPNTAGGFDIGGIDQNSPQFLAANTSCAQYGGVNQGPTGPMQ